VPNLLANGLDIRFETLVKTIRHNSRHIILEAINETFEADAAIITLPLGVLKSKSVEFAPALPSYVQKSIDLIPLGSFNKIALRFPEPFWQTDCDLIELIPETRSFVCQFINWFRYTQEPILIACLAADTSRQWEMKSDEEQKQLIMKVLRQYFGNSIPEPVNLAISRWGQDTFTLGAYSIVPPGVCKRDFEALGLQLGHLYFAGEATSLSAQGTVHGAYESGIRAARQLLASFR
jgi:monoamine oxidase